MTYALPHPDNVHAGGQHVTWFKVDDSLATHHKVVAAGNSAMGLWVRAGSWCAQQLTDGFIPASTVGILGTATQARRLVTVGLWIKVDGGYRFHEWDASGRQPTRSAVLDRRKREAEKKSRARAARNEPKSTDAQVTADCPQGTDAGHPTGHPTGVTGGVRSTRPVPSRPVEEQAHTPCGSPTATRPPRSPQGTRIPADFVVTDEMIAWARESTPLVGRAETENFRDYWTAASGRTAVKKDWVAAWRYWMRKAQSYAESREAHVGGYRSTTDDNIRHFMRGNGSGPTLRVLPAVNDE
jgi:hypothetical protein